MSSCLIGSASSDNNQAFHKFATQYFVVVPTKCCSQLSSVALIRCSCECISTFFFVPAIPAKSGTHRAYFEDRNLYDEFHPQLIRASNYPWLSLAPIIQPD